MKSNTVIALFVEGPTEIEFYKAVVKKAHQLMGGSYSCEIRFIDMQGIGKYKKDAQRKFNNLKKLYPDKEILVFLCIDNDAFKFSRKPPFNKEDVKRVLKEAGAKAVTYIVAKQSIEDWFLSDLSGVLNYLRLPKSTNLPKGSGQESLEKLFKKAKKLYIKGSRTEGFIEKLNLEKIMKLHCDSLRPLCKSLNLDCKLICKK